MIGPLAANYGARKTGDLRSLVDQAYDVSRERCGRIWRQLRSQEGQQRAVRARHADRRPREAVYSRQHE
jgi:hypothetical protein